MQLTSFREAVLAAEHRGPRKGEREPFANVGQEHVATSDRPLYAANPALSLVLSP
jgi:hypothetical protein